VASLSSLADIAEVEARLGYTIVDNTIRAKLQKQLDDASVVVRNYCRRDFTAGTSTIRLRPRGDKVTLPERPVRAVTAVSSVVTYGTSTQVTPLSYWSWVAGPEIQLGDQSLVINGPTLDFSDGDTWVEVTYDHGFAVVPDDVVSVVANMALRTFTIPGGGLVDMQTVGPYSARTASFASGGPLSLSGGDRDVLNKYRGRVSGTMELRP
jgi:hypothetical protein